MAKEENTDNFTLQKEELEALASIYGTDFTIEDEFGPTFSIVVHVGETEIDEATLVVSFCPEYPAETRPHFQLSVPWIRGKEKQVLTSALEEIYLQNPGKCIIYDWVEKLRELLLQNVHSNLPPVDSEFFNSLKEDVAAPTKNSFDVSQLPQFVTGEPLTDRKSTFQAHAVRVTNQAQVEILLNRLLENKRISSATHNMYAYRIFEEETKLSWQDCDDDGETHGGTRLLHLLQILGCKNVLVVVSRWYGGVKLYGDRFKHINNVARKLLQEEGLVPANSKS